MQPLISVIIPIYKVEKFLDKCIESVVNQTYKNLEIILVDDGSPDNCPKMCDDWAKKDSRIKVVHKVNGGLSDARNVGLNMSTGDYIMFVDSDDWLELSMIDELYLNLINYNADISIGNIRRFYEKNGSKEPLIENIQIKQYDNNVFDCLLENYTQSVIACGKIFKKEILGDNPFPVGKINEDECVVHRFLNNCKKVVYTNKQFYNYYLRANSITSQTFGMKNLNVINALQERLKFFKDNGFDEKFIVFTYEQIFSHLASFYFRTKDKVIRKVIKEKFNETLLGIGDYRKKLSLKVKIKIILFKNCKWLLRLIIK